MFSWIILKKLSNNNNILEYENEYMYTHMMLYSKNVKSAKLSTFR